MKIILVSILIAATPYLAKCQFREAAHFDFGSSTVSSAPFLRFSSVSQYNWNRIHGLAGFRYTLSNVEGKNLSGLKIALGGDFDIFDLPLTADLFFLQNPLTKLTRESNFGFIVKHERRRMQIDLGYHARKYSLDKNAIETSDLEPGADLSIWEYRNFIYRGTLFLKDKDANWNISVSATNYDHFLIQQETNPMFNIAGYYQHSESLKIIAECWYQGAGMLNLHPNHFGYYFKTGLEWTFGK
jgi:hypothetical protein